MKLKLLWALLFILVVIDGVITNYLINNDIATEGNMYLTTLAGDSSLIVAKIVGGIIAVAFLWHISKKKYLWSYMTTGVFVFIYSGIVGWNLFWCL